MSVADPISPATTTGAGKRIAACGTGIGSRAPNNCPGTVYTSAVRDRNHATDTRQLTVYPASHSDGRAGGTRGACRTCRTRWTCRTRQTHSILILVTTEWERKQRAIGECSARPGIRTKPALLARIHNTRLHHDTVRNSIGWLLHALETAGTSHVLAQLPRPGIRIDRFRAVQDAASAIDGQQELGQAPRRVERGDTIVVRIKTRIIHNGCKRFSAVQTLENKIPKVVGLILEPGIRNGLQRCCHRAQQNHRGQYRDSRES